MGTAVQAQLKQPEGNHVPNLVNRTNVPADPEKNMNAAEDFMLLLVHAHVVAAARAIPEPCRSVSELAQSVLSMFAQIPLLSEDSTSDSKQKDGAKTPAKSVESEQKNDHKVDGVHVYATELLTPSLIWHGFHDATREGDGDRILRYWKFLLIVFKASNRSNYAK